MTASEDRATSGVLQASGAATSRNERLAVVALIRFWATIARVFDRRLVRRLDGWVRVDRATSELDGMSDRELRDLGINRADIAALRAGTYKRGSTDETERIVFRPEAGKPVTPERSERR